MIRIRVTETGRPSRAGRTDRRVISTEAASDGGAAIRVTARRVGSLFYSRAGRECGPGLWDLEVRMGRRRRRASWLGTVAEVRKDVRDIASRLAKQAE